MKIVAKEALLKVMLTFLGFVYFFNSFLPGFLANRKYAEVWKTILKKECSQFCIMNNSSAFEVYKMFLKTFYRATAIKKYELT